MNPITFDTNIVNDYKVESLPKNFYMSAVVLSERMTAANDIKEFRAYQTTWKRHLQNNTLLVPTPEDWMAASRVLFMLAQERKRMSGGRSPRRASAAKQELAMDALLAMSARRLKVTVVTDDADFDAIHHYYKDLRLIRGAVFFNTFKHKGLT